MSENNYNNEELIEEYKKNQDEKIVELILENNKPLVIKYARGMSLAGGDTDDLIQEGMIGLYHAIISYKEGKGANFTTYAATCIRNKLYSAVKASLRKKHTPLNQSISLIEDNDNNDDSFFNLSENNPESIFLNNERYSNLKNSIFSALSPMEKEVLTLYIEGNSYKTIAEKLEIPVKSVDNSVYRIRKKILNIYKHMEL